MAGPRNCLRGKAWPVAPALPEVVPTVLVHGYERADLGVGAVSCDLYRHYPGLFTHRVRRWALGGW